MKHPILSIIVAVVMIAAFSPSPGQAQVTGDFRSLTTGTWRTAAGWERFNGSNWVTATAAPTATANGIAVRDGNVVSIDSNVTFDQGTIEAGGQVTINPGFTWTMANGAGTDLFVYGTLLNSGTMSIGSGATWTLASGGTYIHNTTSSFTAPFGSAVVTIAPGSTVIFRGSSTLATATSFSGRTFSNLIYESESGTWSIPGPTSGSLNWTVNGDLTVGANVRFSYGTGWTGNSLFNGNVTVDGVLGDGGTARSFTIANGKELSLSATGSVNVAAGRVVTIASGGSASMDGGTVEGAGNFTLASGATLVTSHANGLDGAITVAGTKALSAGANFEFRGAGTGTSLPGTVNNLTINRTAGDVTLEGGTATQTINGTLNVLSGNLARGATTATVNAGSVIMRDTQINSNLALALSGGVTFDATNNGTATIAGSVNLGASARTFAIANGSAAVDMLVSGNVFGAGGVAKTGTGTLTLSGANNYLGTTQVAAGTLQVDGNQSAATGAVTVATGATLAGTGSLGGAVTIADGATLVGQQGSTLTMGGLTLNPTSLLSVSLGTPSVLPVFQVNGNLTLDGTMDVTSLGGFGPGLYRIFDYTGSLSDNGLVLGSVPPDDSVSDFAVQTSVANQVNLIYNATGNNFWSGGSGTWSASPANTQWTDFSGGSPAPWQPAVAIFGGALAGTVTIDASAGPVVVTGMQFARTGYAVTGGNLTTNTANTTLRVGNGAAAGATYTATIASAIVGTGGIRKTDFGTLILSGANAYTGTTTVSSGTLLINGNSSAVTAPVTVGAGGALGGSGRIGGAVTVADGGALQGVQGNTFTVAGLALNSASQVNITLGAPSTIALFSVLGNLTLDGTLNVTNAGAFGYGVYRLFNYTGTLTNNELDIGQVPGGVSTQALKVQTSRANQVNLLYEDITLPLPNWAGGSGVWSIAPSGNWSNEVSTGGWRSGFALFQDTAGAVTVDTGPGAVGVTGIQFASNGYSVHGGALTTNTANTVIRVGDGTAASAGFRAIITSPIIGIGGINKDDFGTLILSGANAYTGGTTVSRGVLEIASNANLGATSGGVTFNGGTLRTTAALSSARAVTLASGGTVDTAGNAVTLVGVISGTGSLTKTGTGVLTLAGNNTFTGATTIDQGGITLLNSSLAATTIAQGAQLGGIGTIRGNLTNQGLLSPGTRPGPVTVNGNYSQASTGNYLVELASASSFDRLIVNGTAQLGGTLTITGIGSYAPAVGQSFTILNATGGVSGTFSAIDSPWTTALAMRRLNAVYNSNDVTLTYVQRAFAGLRGTANQAAVGAAVDSALAAGTVPVLVSVLNSLPTDESVLAALNELSPQRYERWFEQALYTSEATVRTAENRLGRRGIQPESGLWFEVLQGKNSFDATGGSTAAEANASGIMIGGDTAITPDFQIGALFGYTEEELDLNRTGSSSGVQRLSLAAYGRYHASALVFDAVLGARYANHDNARTALIPGYTGRLTGQVGSTDVFTSLRVGYPLSYGALRVTPYGGAHILRWNADPLNEAGSHQAALRVDGQKATAVSTRLGAQVVLRTMGQRIRFTPTFDLAWRYATEGEGRDITASLGGSRFTVRTRAPNSSGFIGSFGLNAAVTDRMTGYIKITAERSTATDKALEAGAGFGFRF